MTTFTTWARWAVLVPVVAGASGAAVAALAGAFPMGTPWLSQFMVGLVVAGTFLFQASVWLFVPWVLVVTGVVVGPRLVARPMAWVNRRRGTGRGDKN